MKLRYWITTLVVVACPLMAGKDEDERLNLATTTLSEMAGASDKGIPAELLNKSVCVVVVPSLKKGGFLVGAKYGRGFTSCRTGAGGWTGPAGTRIEGGSFGLQAGAAESDVILLVMNKAGMEKLLKSKMTLGGEASAAAGPVGRETQAMTDAMLHAEILSWSRSKGAFAGISLQGSTLRQDDEPNNALYSKGTTNESILTGKVKAPTVASSTAFVAALTKYSPTQGK